MKVWITSSSMTTEPRYLELSRHIAEHFAKNNDELICGGIKDSMEKVIFEEYQKYNGAAHCVTLEYYHENLEQVDHKYLVDSTFDRTKKLYQMADMIIVLPGGIGSLAEIFSILEEKRTLRANKKIILYNEKNFFEPLLKTIEHIVQNKFCESMIQDTYIVVNTIEELKKKVSE